MDLLESATGVNFGGIEDLNKIGERIFTLERLFNFRIPDLCVYFQGVMKARS